MNIMGELAVLFGVCLIAEGVSALLPVPFPASVIGMLLLLALLMVRVVRERHIDRVCGFLSDNMSFFFVAPCVGLLKHLDVLLQCLVPFCIIARRLFCHRLDSSADPGLAEKERSPA